ncbi:hypothetical protein Dimus_026630, partial [Dionaea muscipula]
MDDSGGSGGTPAMSRWIDDAETREATRMEFQQWQRIHSDSGEGMKMRGPRDRRREGEGKRVEE